MRALWLAILLVACDPRPARRLGRPRLATNALGDVPAGPLLAPSVLDLGGAPPHCGPTPGAKHCLLLDLKRGDAESLVRLSQLLARDGLALDTGPATIVASDAQLASIFRARVDYEIAMASASDGFICEARLEHVHIPPRYAPYLRSLQVGHQICE